MDIFDFLNAKLRRSGELHTHIHAHVYTCTHTISEFKILTVFFQIQLKSHRDQLQRVETSMYRFEKMFNFLSCSHDCTML